MGGPRVVITGATSGIGLAAARALAAPVEEGGHDAEVVMAVRNVAKGRELAAGIPRSSVVELDLADLSSVRSINDRLDGEIDILVHNAGVAVASRQLTVDGFETDIGTNFLGPFALTAQLIDRVRERIVIVGSDAYTFGALDLDDLQWERRRYRAMPAYGASKLADMLFGYELTRRQQLPVMLAHPGWAATGLSNATTSDRVNKVISAVSGLFAQSAEAGAQCTVYAATAPIPNGSYVGPDGWRAMHGQPTLLGRARTAVDPETAERLWGIAEELTGSVLCR